MVFHQYRIDYLFHNPILSSHQPFEGSASIIKIKDKIEWSEMIWCLDQKNIESKKKNLKSDNRIVLHIRSAIDVVINLIVDHEFCNNVIIDEDFIVYDLENY